MCRRNFLAGELLVVVLLLLGGAVADASGDVFSVNFYMKPWPWPDTDTHNITLEDGNQSAGFDDWLTDGWQDIEIPWAPPGPQDPVTITSKEGATATYTLKAVRNGGAYFWDQVRTTLLGDGNADMMDGHANSTEDAGELFEMTVSDIPFSSYDVIVYLGSQEAQFFQGKGTIVFDGVQRDLTLKSGIFDGTFVEMVDAATPGNYILYEGLTDSSFTVQTWGDAFTHLGLTGFQFREANPASAAAPDPAHEATDVCSSAVLEWTPGEGAISHNVYFGSDPDNWDQQSLGQSAASYDPGPLELGAVYFWQVDENDGVTTHKGDIWQFTVEPVSYEIPGASIIATADSNDINQGPDKTIDRSGLDEAGLHSTELTDMWVSAEASAGDPWIQYEFDKEYKLDKLFVWNHNSPLESIVGLGIKDALIEYSTDGQTWQSLGGAAVQLDRAPGAAGYGGGTPVDLGGIVAKYVKITAQSNWGNIVSAAGLSEVRFFYIPTRVRTPDPADKVTEVAYNAILSWAPGRDAVSHDVYLSTNRQAVEDGSVAAVSIPADDICLASYTPELALGQTYYWKVNESDGAKTWDGDVWRFSTEEYRVVDDMTSYGDVDEIGVPDGRIWFVWRDGEGWMTPEHPSKGGNGTGSVVDRYVPESYETPQSLWYSYDNDGRNYLGSSNKSFYSEVTANISDLPIGSDWTAAGVKALSIRFYGDANNIATEQLYVKLNGSKVVYDGDMADIAEADWHEWLIPLSQFGTNLQNVTQISIGFGDENNTVARDARGIVFFDDIRLYPAKCVPENRSPEFARFDYIEDCVVDYKEVEAMLESWLAVAAPEGTVPNGDFEGTYKPLTLTAGSVSDGGWSLGVGPDCPIDSGQYVFSDGTTGRAANLPGWIGYDRDGWIALGGTYGRDQTTGNFQGSISTQHNATEGGAQAYLSNGGDWGNPAGGLIVSDAPLGNVETGTYTLSMMANGEATPIVLELHAGGVALTPSSSVNPELTTEWQEFSRTYDSASLAGSLGQPLTIVLGVGRNAIGTQSRFDDVKLLHSPDPLPTQMLRLAGRTVDLNDDKMIDFKDFSLLADRFLDENMWP